MGRRLILRSASLGTPVISSSVLMGIRHGYSHIKTMPNSSRLYLAAALSSFAACSSDSITEPTDTCGFVSIPFSGSGNAPRITSVILEVQDHGVVAAATATDPQGTDNVLNIQQSFSVFRNARCEGTTILIRDDIASGQEETFGTVFEKSTDGALYNAIKAATTWPVTLDFVDRDGNRTTGKFRAQVVLSL